MLYHTAICVTDVARSAIFYDEVLATLGMERIIDLPGAVGYGGDHAEFWIQSPQQESFLTVTIGGHYAFQAESQETVDAFHSTALKAGGKTALTPARHPQYGPNYYGAVIEDLDGQMVEILFKGRPLQQ